MFGYGNDGTLLTMKKPAKALKKPTIKQRPEVRFEYKWFFIIVTVIITGFGLSVFNNYCLDDFIVIGKNKYTQQGIAGLAGIFAYDTFAGMTEGNLMVLEGGRYRPLSVASFALEHQLYGDSPFMAHMINVALYAMLCFLLFRFLKQLQLNETLSGLSSVLFAAMPAHTEPVINVKGRDDIMCLLFFLLAAIQLMHYVNTSAGKHLFYAVVFYFLSLLSKEAGVAFVVVFPLVLFLFTQFNVTRIFKTSWPFAVAAVFFLLLRFLATMNNSGSISSDVLNNPFVGAAQAEKFATIIYTWLLYFKLMFWPVHLSYDYNFNQIPLTDFKNFYVWVSLAWHAFIFAASFYFIKRKPILSFGLLFYLITFSVYSNLFFSIGAPFADRFIFIPSAGICIFIVAASGEFYNFLITKKSINFINKIMLAIFFIAIGLFTARNMMRCEDWKDNNTLFLGDVDDAPNSAKVQLNAGLAYINRISELKTENEKAPLYDSAMVHLKKGIEIYPEYPDGYLNMGVIYNWKEDYANAEEWWLKAYRIKPDNSTVHGYFKILATYYYRLGMQSGAQKQFRQSADHFKHALLYDSLNTELLYNTGGAYFSLNLKDSAAFFWKKTLFLDPAHSQAAQGMAAISR